MKKVLAVVAVVCVVCAAGAALAQPRAREEGRRVPPQVQPRQQVQQGQPGQPGQPGQRFNRPAQFNGAPCYCGREFDRRPGDDRGRNFGPRNDGMRPEGRRGLFTPDMTEEIREKAVKIAKLRIDLDAALSQNPIDKDSALEAFTKIQKLEQEIEVWRFEKKLEGIEAFRKQRELNRNVPPAPPAPPAPEAPAPEAPADKAE